MELRTIVTFEGTRKGGQGGYAVVQRGQAKKIVTRERGERILAGTETIKFSADEIRHKAPREPRKHRSVLTGLSTIQIIRLGLGLDKDDTSQDWRITGV